MVPRLSALFLTLLLGVAMVTAQGPFYRFPQGGGFGGFQRFPSSSFVPLRSISGPQRGITRDYFGGVGGSRGLPIWGGAGIGERHANGLDRYGRGLIPA